jgi:hypothetical protein
MKNAIIALFMFIIMIIGIFISTNAINRSCNHLQDLNSQLENYILNENYKDAYDLSLIYIDEWKKASNFLTVFIHHEDLNYVDSEILKLTQYTKINDKSEGLATVHVMKYLIDKIMYHEKVSISNVF